MEILNLIVHVAGGYLILNGFFITKISYKDMKYGWSCVGTIMFGFGIALLMINSK